MNRETLNKVTDLNHPEPDHIEPGLLATFRAFMIFQLVVLIVALAITYAVGTESGVIWYGLASLTWTTALLVYLSWPAARRRLGAAYLPVALFVASAMPIAVRLAVYTIGPGRGVQFTAAEGASSGWRLFVVLVIPLVLIAWQYDFRAVLAFSGGTLLLSLTAAYFLFEPGSAHWDELIGLSISTAVAFALIGYVVSRLVKAQREKQLVLEEANARLLDHAATVEQLAVSQERNRLARDLHDTLAHTLSAVIVQLEATDSAWDYSPEVAHDILHKTQENARSGLAETRRALRALRATPLEDLGLVLALRSLAESIAARNGLELELDLPDTLTLAPDTEESIYRIAQEALTNAARHADAHSIWVKLDCTLDEVILEIRDDGGGFGQEVATDQGHFGMRGMEERAETIDATITIESQPQVGTTVRLVAPRNLGGMQ